MPPPATYDRIGDQYDTTRRADPNLTGRLIALLQPRSDGRYLDVACGSGNYTTALANKGVDIIGVDLSARMIAAARNKNPDARWILANATALPFDDAVFDGAVCTLAIHHFDDIARAFTEIRRVLRGGRFVLLTATHEQMRGYWLSEYFPNAIQRSIEQMPDRPAVEAALRRTGFASIQYEPYEIQPDLRDFFLYSGKHRPDIYLDPTVRAGISTFRLLADPREVASGCAQLAHDIESGRINDVIRRYAHEDGDYLFIAADARPPQ